MEYNWTHLKHTSTNLDNFVKCCTTKTPAMTIKVFDYKNREIDTYKVDSCFDLEKYIMETWHQSGFTHTYKKLQFTDQLIIIVYNNNQLIEKHIGNYDK